MQAIRIQKFGGPQVLQLVSGVPIPKPKGSNVLVNVKAAGVNPVDTYIREGAYSQLPDLPFTPGKDGAGIVKEVGSGVTKVKVGQRVFFCSLKTGNGHGSYAEYALMDEKEVWPLSEKLTFSQGAAVGVPYLTAYRSLIFKAKAQKGETILVHGATGSVGIAAVQLAKAFKMTVIGSAGTPEGMELLKKIGTDLIVSHKDKNHTQQILEATNNKGVDVVLEMLANVNLSKDLTVLARNGRVIIIGSRGSITINPRDTMGLETSIIGTSLFSSTDEEWRKSSEEIVQGIENGWVSPIVAKEYPLAKAADSHHDIIHSKGAQGRLVLIPGNQ